MGTIPHHQVVVENSNCDAGSETVFRLPNTHRLSHLLKLQGSFLPSSSIYSPSIDPSGFPSIYNVTAGLSTVTAVQVSESGQQHQQQQKLGLSITRNPGGTVCVVAIQATVGIPLTSKSYVNSKEALAAVLQLRPWSVGYDPCQQQYDSSTSTQNRLNDLYRSLRPPPLEDFCHDDSRTRATIGRFQSLPIEHLHRILCYAGALSLRQLSTCSRGTLASCMGIYPGLKLNLFPHQVRALPPPLSFCLNTYIYIATNDHDHCTETDRISPQLSCSTTKKCIMKAKHRSFSLYTRNTGFQSCLDGTCGAQEISVSPNVETTWESDGE